MEKNGNAKIFKKSQKKKKILAILIISAFIAMVIWYFFFHSAASSTKYIVQAVENGSLKVTVSGTGQVSALQQINVKPEIANSTSNTKIKTLNILTTGQMVKAGDILATLDDKTAQSSLRQAEASLASAKEQYIKVIPPAEQLS